MGFSIGKKALDGGMHTITLSLGQSLVKFPPCFIHAEGSPDAAVSVYGIHPSILSEIFNLDPRSILLLSIFAHLYEGWLGARPNLTLWR